jgi:hypothetical protein
MCRRFLSILGVSFLYGSSMQNLVFAQDCGIDLSSKIRFTGNYSQSERHPFTNEVTLIQVQTTGEKDVLSIMLPEEEHSRSRFLTSSDGGHSWETVDLTKMLPFDPAKVINVVGDYQLGNTLFTNDPSEACCRLLRSDDGGRTWRHPALRFDPALLGGTSAVIPPNYHISFSLVGQSRRESGTVFANVLVAADDPVKDNSKAFRPNRLYVSHDGAESWKLSLDNPLPFTPVGGSANVPEVFYALGEGYSTMKSVNRGDSWVKIPGSSSLSTAFRNATFVLLDTEKEIPLIPEVARLRVQSLLVDPTQSSEIFVVTNMGLLHSKDEGVSWKLIGPASDSLNSVTGVVIGMAPSRNIYITTVDGMFVSRNRGCTFEQIYPGPSAP